jgi:RNA polymerase sigma-70 factor (ECF subfamily)
VLRGDQRAYADLVRAHQDRLLASAYHLCGDRDLAQDLAQEALVQGYSSLGTLRDPGSFGPWTYGILRNLFRQHLAHRPPAEVSLERDPVAEPPAPADDLSETRMVMQTLPLEHREVLAARYLQELDYAEIAALLGLTVNATRVRVFRAKQALRAALAGEGGEAHV